MNPVMWTLVIEVQFYITLPLLFLGFRRVSAKTTFAVITSLFFVIPILMRAVTKQAATFYPNIDPHFPSALDAFSFGILIAGLENLGLVKKSWVKWGVAGAVLWPLTLLAAAWLSLHTENKTFVTNEILQGGLRFSAACLLLFIADPKHPIARLLCAPWLRWCGIVSYEWYLFHQPLALWSRAYFRDAGGNVFKYALIVGVPLVLGLVVSASIYRFFSLPILRYGRDKNQH
jgi:peptidoglycan/LPS O-acetylase OafA/YrhL